ncbi:MAG: DNA polymerase I [Bacteroidaceae bacterium]|nr:DNA polymerase I [Bacteroidaceae bacterium]
MQKLYLLDAYALIYRAYYAFIKNPRINSRGENTSAILGFVNTLEEVITKEVPTHLGVAFDPHGGTFRHEAYPEYKAQREETPEAIRFAVPIIKDILAAYHIPVLEVPGFEADDVIGTLAHQADLKGIDTFMMTPDKDYGQLVTERVRQYRPPVGRNSEAEILGPEEVNRKWGLQSPRQVIDMLGLMGDAVDNIPGCPGVGEKTAQKLIEEFGSIENLLASTDKLKGALKEKVEQNVEKIKQSKWLATINQEVPISLDMDLLQLREPDTDRLQELFGRLEFRQLLNKKPGPQPSSEEKESQSIKNNDGSMQLDLFNTAPAPQKPAAQPQQLDLFDMDRASTSLTSLTSGTSEASQAEAFVVEDGTVIGHNLKANWQALKAQGLTDLPMFDTEIAHYILHPEMRHYLDYLLSIYGCKGVYELKQSLEKELQKEGLWSLFTDIEMPLMPVLAEMEEAGVMIDTEGLKETSRLFTEQMLALEQEIHSLAGLNFNISSPKQVGEVLFETLKLDSKAKKTKKGQYVTNEEVLEALRRKHPIVGKILEYRGLKKLLGTYIDTLPSLINPQTGHIHTSFNQTVTATGRLSSSNPNLQNIPVRDAQGKEVRKAFIPYPGQLFFSADYSQIELRIMAHLSKDENLIEAFMQGNDIHQATASKIFKKPLEDVTPDERRKAKTANFGIIYGISAFGLAERMGVSRTEAKQLIDDYFQTYPGVKAYMEKSIEMARECGFTETIFKRRCQLPDINSNNSVVRGYAERNAINAPIQGSAADIIKIAMIRISRRMKEEGLKSKMILQVHDELNFSVLPEEKEKLQALVIEEMQGAASLSVPLIADCGWGTNWLEAH